MEYKGPCSWKKECPAYESIYCSQAENVHHCSYTYEPNQMQLREGFRIVEPDTFKGEPERPKDGRNN
jgi:hypothetical protein